MCDRREPQTLDRSECLRLLKEAHVGRVIFTRNSLPAVEPVRYVLECGGILILTESGSELARAVDNTVVAFEADDVAADLREGWSVTGIGQAEVVAQDHEIERAAEAFRRCDANQAPQYIRIDFQRLVGRLLPPPPDTGEDEAQADTVRAAMAEK